MKNKGPLEYRSYRRNSLKVKSKGSYVVRDYSYTFYLLVDDYEFSKRNYDLYRSSIRQKFVSKTLLNRHQNIYKSTLMTISRRDIKCIYNLKEYSCNGY